MIQPLPSMVVRRVQPCELLPGLSSRAKLRACATPLPQAIVELTTRHRCDSQHWHWRLSPRRRLSSGMTRLRSVTRRRCVAPLPAPYIGPMSASDRCVLLLQMMRQQMLQRQQQQGQQQQQQQYARAAQQQAQLEALQRAQVQSLGSHKPTKSALEPTPTPLNGNLCIQRPCIAARGDDERTA